MGEESFLRREGEGWEHKKKKKPHYLPLFLELHFKYYVGRSSQYHARGPNANPVSTNGWANIGEVSAWLQVS